MSNPITEGPILKPLLSFFFPILFGTFFQQLYNTVDAIIVGNFVGTAALGAVGGPTSVIINLLINLFVGVSAGATVVIAQYHGARQTEDLQQTIHTGAALALVAGALFTVIGLLISQPILKLMDTPTDVLEHASTYIRVYFCGTIASFIYNMGASILRAIGDTRRPLYFLMAACLTNIVLDLLFVVVLGLGVLGVGLATVLSQVVSAILVIRCLLEPGSFYRIDPRAIRFYPGKLGAILRIGLPAGMQSNMYTFTNLILQSKINAFSTLTVAAWTAFGKIDTFYFMIGSALGVSLTTFVSQNFGARQYDRVRKGVRIALMLAFGMAICISCLFCLAARPLLQMFTPDVEVIRLGTYIVWHMSPFYFAFVCIEILSSTIRGSGESFKPMLITCCGVCVFRVLWVLLILPHYPQLDTILLSYPISWSVTSLIYIIFYLRGNWFKRGIARQEELAPAKATNHI